jgi:hypothetical protein
VGGGAGVQERMSDPVNVRSVIQHQTSVQSRLLVILHGWNAVRCDLGVFWGDCD